MKTLIFFFLVGSSIDNVKNPEVILSEPKLTNGNHELLAKKESDIDKLKRELSEKRKETDSKVQDQPSKPTNVEKSKNSNDSDNGCCIIL